MTQLLSKNDVIGTVVLLKFGIKSCIKLPYLGLPSSQGQGLKLFSRTFLNFIKTLADGYYALMALSLTKENQIETNRKIKTFNGKENSLENNKQAKWKQMQTN